jgi:hypothetical protein
MDDWISDLLLFSAGVAAGVLAMMVAPLLSAAKKRRTEMVAARAKMLAGIKQQHDEEILDEAFRTTEAIRGELDKSLTSLRKMLNTAFDPPDVRPSSPQIIDLTEPSKPERPA